MLIIPLVATPSQTLSVTLNQQACAIAVYAKATGVFLDLSISGVQIMGAVLCRDRVRLVRQPYLGFIGDIVFIDTQGSTDPDYTGLGSRYLLAYLLPEEIS